MPDQSAQNVIAAVKEETTPGVAATGGAGATVIRMIDSPGLEMTRGVVNSAERRRDQLMGMGRLSGKDVSGTFNQELLVGGAPDLFLPALVRNSWTAAVTAAPVNVTTTATEIVRASGDWRTDGYRQGDIITILDDTTTANNNVRMMVRTLNALTLTVMSSPGLTANLVARDVTITRLKKTYAQASATPTLVPKAFTIEQYEGDIDQGELFIGCRVTGGAWSFRPRAMSTVAWTLMGVDRQIIDTAAAPYFTSPTLTTGDPMVADDGYIFYKGAPVTRITGIDLNLSIAAATTPVIGSLIANDVYTNQLTITATITAIRASLAALQDFDAETEFAVGMILREPQGTPRPCFGVYMPRVKISRVSAPFLGGDAAKVETRELMFGPNPASTNTDGSAITFFSSAA